MKLHARSAPGAALLVGLASVLALPLPAAAADGAGPPDTTVNVAQNTAQNSAANTTTGPAAATPRRVVTGLDAGGKAVVLFDNPLSMPAGRARYPVGEVWTTGGSPAGYSWAEDKGPSKSVAPAAGGSIFRIVEFTRLSPEAEKAMDMQTMMKVVGDHAPKRGLTPTHPMMHRTRSVDYALVLSGEIDMLLDDSVVHLKAGDVVVQQATNHAWVNRSAVPCRVAFVLLDAAEP